MMKKTNDKQMHRLGVGVLAVMAVVLIFAIGSQLNPSESEDDFMVQKNHEKVSVETLPQEPQEKNIHVPEIKPIETRSTKDVKEEQDFSQEPMPMPIEAEKAELEAPDHKPQTKDNLNDPSKVPTYNDKDLVKEGKNVSATEAKKSNEPVNKKESKATESKLVPPSENPFANPANVGKPVEVNGEDISDHVPGTGDKF